MKIIKNIILTPIAIVCVLPIALFLAIRCALSKNFREQTILSIQLLANYYLFKESWTKENYQLGIDLGYPKCCVNSFCNYPPQITNSELLPLNYNHKLRLKAGTVRGEFTGFIPCTDCAVKVLSDDVTLISLIDLTKRKHQYGNFKYKQHEM
jgi:hypothetical protein